MLRTFQLLLLPFSLVWSHGTMTVPSPRQGVGSKLPPSLNTTVANGDSSHNAWFSNNINPKGDPNRIEIPGNATNCEPDMLTTMVGAERCGTPSDPYAKRPWRAPGTAKILSPCGVLGGGPPCDVTGAWKCDNEGDGQRPRGTDGVHLPPTLPRTVWRQGTSPMVAFSIQANHGGGYAWRLCPAGEEVTEACFQRGHLPFAKNKTSVVHWNDGREYVIPRVSTVTGTAPPFSEWARNPIPGGSGNGEHTPFKRPCPGCDTCAKGDFEAGLCGSLLELHNFSVVDRVDISRFPPGDYVLGWRWDCEVNPQVWSNCADVTIATA